MSPAEKLAPTWLWLVQWNGKRQLITLASTCSQLPVTADVKPCSAMFIVHQAVIIVGAKINACLCGVDRQGSPNAEVAITVGAGVFVFDAYSVHHLMKDARNLVEGHRTKPSAEARTCRCTLSLWGEPG